MYQKYLVQKLLDKYADKFIADLRLTSWKINFHVYHSNSKELTKLKLSRSSRVHLAGVSFIGKKCADIIIYYDALLNRQDALATIIHELLHLRLDSLVGLITIKQDHANKIEEQIVLDIERLIQRVMYR